MSIFGRSETVRKRASAVVSNRSERVVLSVGEHERVMLSVGEVSAVCCCDLLVFLLCKKGRGATCLASSATGKI